MQTRDLKKLKRSELLEIMLAQSDEIDRLRSELAEKDRALEEREIKIRESGSIAEASLKLTKVFEEAQKAADLYLASVKANGAEPLATVSCAENEPAEDILLDRVRELGGKHAKRSSKGSEKRSGKRLGKHSGKHGGSK